MDHTGFNTISLFSGYGGLDLGVELAGFRLRTLAYVEREAYAASVLLARMAEQTLGSAPICTDVCEFDGYRFSGMVDLLTGGFPCQDISVAGRGEGIAAGTRSGLWFEFARIIREVRPRYVFMENVPAITVRGLDIVLGDLAQLGFDAVWCGVRAEDMGAPHRRERWFCLAKLADPLRMGERQRTGRDGVQPVREELGNSGILRRQGQSRGRTGQESADGCPRSAEELAHSDNEGSQGRSKSQRRGGDQLPAGTGRAEVGAFPPGPDDRERWIATLASAPFLAPALESSVCGVVDGTPDWMESAMDFRSDRLRLLGNGVVPQQAALAFRLLWEKIHEVH